MEKSIETDKIDLHEFEILSNQKFILLSIFSLGLYGSWWVYKSWRFFKYKDNLDIMPAARAIFSILFLHSLFDEIKSFAKSNGYTKTFSSNGYFVGFLVFNLLSRLPDPFWLVSFLSLFFLLPALESLNFGIRNSEYFNAIENEEYNSRQKGIIFVGAIFWVLILVGMFGTLE